MNLLNNQKKTFITESVWISLLDETHRQNVESKVKLKDILDQKHRIFTSTYVIDSVVESLKVKVDSKLANKFLVIIDKAVLSDSLKVIWLNRRLRRQTIRIYIQNEAVKIHDMFNFALIKQKKIDLVFTLNFDFYENCDLHCL